MSYPCEKAASTPIRKTVVSINSNSISPILTTPGPSSSRKLGKRRIQKRQRSPLSRTNGKLKIQKRAYENDIVREAPPPIADIRSIIDEPLHPRPQILPPKDPIERIDRDVEYVQVPEPETTCNSHEHAEKNTESEESEEEYHVLRPQKTFEKPRKRNPRCCDYRVTKVPTNGVPEFRIYDPEAETLWDEFCKDDAKKFVEQQRAAPQKQTMRNREIMLRIRKEAADRVGAAKIDKSSREKKTKKTKKPERSPSPEMITMRGDFSGYTIIDEADPNSRVYVAL